MKLVRPVLAASAGVLLLSLAACGGNGSQASATQQGGQEGQSTQQGGASGAGRGGAGRFPGANGLVAAISGKTLQVQGQSGQTAVTYTASTTFSAQVAAKLADVTVGSCVQVTAPQDAASSGAGGSTTAPTAITAATVRITAATDGSCTRGGFGGGTPGDRPSGAPSGMPTARPSGAPGAGGRGFGGVGAFGQVKAVSGTGFTVTAQQPGPNGDSGQTREVTVTVSADTSYTTTKAATAAALAVGKCVSATGQSDDTGAVAARRISVSDAVNGQCTGGFGGAPAAGAPS
jgi:hypothetical protein